MFLRWPFQIAMKLVSFVVTAAVIYFVISGVQVVLSARLPQGTTALTSSATIVVLGSSVDQNAPSADLLNRLEEGLKCYQAHLASTFTVTGTDVPGQANVANAERGWLEVNGVPKSAIRTVIGSNTASQLQAAAAVIGPGQKVLIVTDAISTYWVKATAVHYRLDPQVAPALNSERPFYDQIGTVLSQAGAVAAGRIIGFERASWA
jgi:uncharacterized SAM-binding protein YcdF (DUF218 family)